jgi:hypothetical protein
MRKRAGRAREGGAPRCVPWYGGVPSPMQQRRPRPEARPFVTRRSTLGFAALFVISYMLWVTDAGSGASDPTISPLAAFLLATSMVSLLVAWVAGLVLAWRSRSMLWVLVACLPPPMGAVPCALFAPAPDTGFPPPRGGSFR